MPPICDSSSRQAGQIDCRKVQKQARALLAQKKLDERRKYCGIFTTCSWQHLVWKKTVGMGPMFRSQVEGYNEEAPRFKNRLSLVPAGCTGFIQVCVIQTNIYFS